MIIESNSTARFSLRQNFVLLLSLMLKGIFYGNSRLVILNKRNEEIKIYFLNKWNKRIEFKKSGIAKLSACA